MTFRFTDNAAPPEIDDVRAPAPSDYEMPPEWEPHAGTILTWPHRPGIWRGLHDEVESTFADLAARLSEVEDVHISVPSRVAEARAARRIEKRGGNLDRVRFHLIDSNDVWARDHGPIFVRRRATASPMLPPLAMLDWDFNAWGGKFESDLDNEIPRQLNDFFQVPRFAPGLILEGGGIEVNGRGDLLTTEAVLLNSNRNHRHDRDDIEATLCGHLGVRNLLWLPAGILGDDTDGHIDDIARFCRPDLIVSVLPDDDDHPDAPVLRRNAALLREMTGADGRHFELLHLPTPEPISFRDEHLPASYANFLIANELVLVPVFHQAMDHRALGILREIFPDREVIGLDCRALVSQYGAIHCVTQQIPRAP